MTTIDDVTAQFSRNSKRQSQLSRRPLTQQHSLLDDISADAATDIGFSAGTFTTLAIGAVTNTSANIDTLTLTASDDANLNIGKRNHDWR